MVAYSPFQRELLDLAAADLAVLRDAREGWYIEYKLALPTATKIAKSISAFANTYGGWLFYGIKEIAKDGCVAGSFPGLARSEIDAALQTITHAITEHVNPAPHFDYQVVTGPCLEIGLTENFSVICIRVPQSNSAPHIHSAGRIYRRVADSSDPLPETDRFLLQQLWQRGEDIRKFYASWVGRDPTLSENEAQAPFLRLLFVADLHRDRNTSHSISLLRFREIMLAKLANGLSIPFDIAHETSSGYVARHKFNNDPNSQLMTWHLFRDLRSEVIIPLTYYNAKKLQQFAEEFPNYHHLKRFTQLLHSEGYKTAQIIDLTPLFTVLQSLVKTQATLLRDAEWQSTYHVKIRLINVWRTIPFIDVGPLVTEFEKNGVPMCLDKAVTIPGERDDYFFDAPLFVEGDNTSASDPASTRPIGQDDDPVDGALRAEMLGTFLLFALVLRAFGVTSVVGEGVSEWFESGSDELLKAVERARSVRLNQNPS